MSPLSRVRHALPATLLAYGFRSFGALLLAWPLLRDLAVALGSELSQRTPAATLAALEVAGRQGRATLYWAASAALGYALLSPLVSLTWLCALSVPRPLSTSLAQAAKRYPGSLLVSVLALLAAAGTAGLMLLALQPEAFALLPAGAASEQTLRSAVFCAAGLAALAIATLSDLARARLATHAGAVRALRCALRELSPALLATHALFLAGALACALAAEALTRALPLAPEPLLVMAQQTLVLFGCLLRAGWLAVATERAGSTPARAG